jgi:hypothetical protein
VSFLSTATDPIIAQNTLQLLAGSTNALLNIGSDGLDIATGVLDNNLLLTDLAQPLLRFNSAVSLAAWSVNKNWYKSATPQWRIDNTVYSTFAEWQAFAPNDLGYSATEPVLTDVYKLDINSPLVGAGKSAAPKTYLGLNGLCWSLGQPSVGCYEALNESLAT